jgi:hypothetical protein
MLSWLAQRPPTQGPVPGAARVQHRGAHVARQQQAAPRCDRGSAACGRLHTARAAHVCDGERLHEGRRVRQQEHSQSARQLARGQRRVRQVALNLQQQRTVCGRAVCLETTVRPDSRGVPVLQRQDDSLAVAQRVAVCDCTAPASPPPVPPSPTAGACVAHRRPGSCRRAPAAAAGWTARDRTGNTRASSKT